MIKNLLLSAFVALIISSVSSFYLIQWMADLMMSTSQQMESIGILVDDTIDSRQIVKLVIVNQIYFLALISLPFLAAKFVQWFKITDKNLWKAILTFEILSLVFAILATSSSTAHALLLFSFCQLIVFANIAAIGKKLKKPIRSTEL